MALIERDRVTPGSLAFHKQTLFRVSNADKGIVRKRFQKGTGEVIEQQENKIISSAIAAVVTAFLGEGLNHRITSVDDPPIETILVTTKQNNESELSTIRLVGKQSIPIRIIYTYCMDVPHIPSFTYSREVGVGKGFEYGPDIKTTSTDDISPDYIELAEGYLDFINTLLLLPETAKDTQGEM